MSLIFSRSFFKDLSVLIGAIFFYFLGVLFYSPGDWALLETSPHPFFILSVLYSAYYGIRHAILSSVIFSFLYLVLVANQVDFQEVESLFLFKFLKLPIILSFQSILVGEIRHRTFKRNDESKRKLHSSNSINKELKGKLEVTSLELQELQKRYATLTESFAENVKLLEDLENKSFEEIIEKTKNYIAIECDVNSVNYYSAGHHSSSEVPKSEKEIMNKLINYHKIYSIKDDLIKSEENRLLSHVPTDIVVPLELDGENKGYFFLEEISFTSLNIFTIKKIENILKIVKIALGSTNKIKNWQENSSFLYPFDIYKEKLFFEEASRIEQNVGDLLKKSGLLTLFVEISLDFSIEADQKFKEKAILLLSHLIKHDRKGVSLVGGTRNLDKVFVFFIASKKDVENEMQQVVAQYDAFFPKKSRENIMVSYMIQETSDEDYKRKLVCVT